MCHHAGLNLADFGGMTAGSAAGFFRDPQVPGIYKTHVVPVFLQPTGVSTLRVGGRTRLLRISRLRMGLILYLSIRVGVLLSTRGRTRLAISSVAIGAAQTNGAGDMHSGTV